MQNIYHIKLTNNTKIVFDNSKKGDVLLCGFIDGMFGEYDEVFKCFGYCDEVAENNVQMLIDTIKNGNKIRVVGDDLTNKYMNDVLCDFISGGIFKRNEIEKAYKGLSCGTHHDTDSYSKAITEQVNRIYEYSKVTNMKFDYIIQNPPYKGNLHLDFLEKGLDLLKEDGKMVIIEPARWLIDLNPNSTYNKGRKDNHAPQIKKYIEGHVESVKIENLNKEFNTGLYVPFAITTIDMSKTFDTINYTCCGEHKIVNSVYDCNLIGNHKSIWGILEKVQTFGTFMKSHITNEEISDDTWYTKFAEIIGCGGCILSDPHNGFSYESDAMYSNCANGDYLWSYTSPSFANKFNEISNTILKRVKRGSTIGELTDKNADCIYGTKEELENWKHFIFNNKLPLFLNIVLTIDQHNNSTEFLPWLVDKQYTDDEINKLFDFTDEEIKLIDTTIKKYERNSPWFKRYMCGPDSVSDEEVNNFIKSL